jgi:hypothetical protein
MRDLLASTLECCTFAATFAFSARMTSYKGQVDIKLPLREVSCKAAAVNMVSLGPSYLI